MEVALLHKERTIPLASYEGPFESESRAPPAVEAAETEPESGDASDPAPDFFFSSCSIRERPGARHVRTCQIGDARLHVETTHNQASPTAAVPAPPAPRAAR